MRAVLLVAWLLIGAAPAFAQQNGNNQGQNNNNQGQNNNNQAQGHQGAPAPLIGFGIPAALAIGGALAGAKLLNRKQ
jgi:hypothetical protein